MDRELWNELKIRDFSSYTSKTATQFFTREFNILFVFEELLDFLEVLEEDKEDDTGPRSAVQCSIDSSFLKFKYSQECDYQGFYEEEESKEELPKKRTWEVSIQILRVNDQIHCVDFSMKNYRIEGISHEIT